MKRFFITLITSLLFAGAAYATPITFTDTTKFTPTGTTAIEDLQSFGGSSVSYLSGIGDYVTWKHFFTFNPPAAEILQGTLKLKLVDDERDTLNPFTWEFAFGFAENGQWDIGAVNTGSYLYDVQVAALEDGEFELTLLSLGGDFSIVRSDLTITYEPVPEPSTILLLSAGLLGLGYVARRRRANV
jgi:hypothetical protein